MAKPTLKVMDAMVGGLRHIGYVRSDLPVFHSIVAAPGGAVFQVADHFIRCDVCRKHKITEEDFHNFMVNPN